MAVILLCWYFDEIGSASLRALEGFPLTATNVEVPRPCGYPMVYIVE